MECRARMMKAGGLVLSFLLTGTLVGCISSHSDVTYGAKGPAIRSDTLRQIKCGQTTKDWVLAVLGEPTRCARTSDDTEVLTYEYTKKIDSDLSFFIFFNADDRREERAIYVFEIEDGIVAKYWREP